MSWCLQSKSGNPDFIIWGDSHADHLFPGIAQTDKKHNWLLIGQSSCPPLLGVKTYKNGNSENECINYNNLIFKYISANKSSQTIVLASLGPFYINGTNFAAEHVLDNMANKFHMAMANQETMKNMPLIFYKGLDKTINQLEKSGKKIVIFQDVPEVPFMPQRCVSRPFSPKFNCVITKSEVIKRQHEYEVILSKLKKKHPNLMVFNSTEYLCTDLTCFVKTNDNLLYRDSHHLSLYGSKVVASFFLEWLDKTSKTSTA
jgi:hypothetical protein